MAAFLNTTLYSTAAHWHCFYSNSKLGCPIKLVGFDSTFKYKHWDETKKFLVYMKVNLLLFLRADCR